MRPIPHTVIEGGIDRQRTKSGVKRNDSLYDLVNGYRTKAKGVVSRPGSRRVVELPANTTGMKGYDGKLHVFSEAVVDVTDWDNLVQCHTLLHPSDPDAELAKIHFAEPFLGALYVVAEFDDASVFHYWLQSPEEWEADTEYSYHELVVPTTLNGFAYRATRASGGYPAWSPGVLRTEGNGSSIDPSIIEPTEYNEYYYTAVSTGGDNPRSGTAEPTWPINDGEQVVENTDGYTAPTADEVTPPDAPDDNQPQASNLEKYQ